MKQYLKIAFLLPLLVSTLTLTAQIERLRQGTSESEENSGTQDQKTEKEKSAASPDTASTLLYTSNLQAAYTLNPFKAPLHNFQNYSPVQKDREMYATLGNNGSAATPITFSKALTPGFNFMHGAFDIYKIKLDSVRFFVLENPFSEINYVMGKAKEQQLLFTHSQQVRKGLTLGLFARYANSPGLYLRQRTYYASGYFTATYVVPSKRYGLLSAYLNDRFINYENGGIILDSVFRENTESNRRTISVNLVNAMNRDKSSGFFFQQYFTLQKQSLKVPDTAIPARQSTRFDAGRIIHTFKYNRQTTAYQDAQSYTNILNGFYPSTYGDSTLTLDSTFHIHLENNLVYSNIEPDTLDRNFPFQYSFGISHHFDKIGYGNVSTMANHLVPSSAFSEKEIVSHARQWQQYNQLIPFGTLKGIIARKTFFIANGRLSVGGYNNGDHELSGSFFQYFGRRGKTGRIYITASQSLVHPDYFYNYFLSDHYRWENNFRMQDYLSGKAGIDLFGYSLSLSFTRISNYIWLNTSVQPEQADGGLAITRADASKIFRPGKWIIDTRVTLQDVSRDSLLQLPSLAARASVSYNLLLFKKVLHAQIGISGQYYTSYHADAYLPEMRMFYRQDNELMGNYPFADVFVNMRIKRARIFIKYQHFNAGWLGYTYYMTPHYPGADAALKAGLSWVFYD